MKMMHIVVDFVIEVDDDTEKSLDPKDVKAEFDSMLGTDDYADFFHSYGCWDSVDVVGISMEEWTSFSYNKDE